MSRRTAALAAAAAVLAALIAVVVFVPMPYVVMSPGVTENTLGEVGGKPVISITGHKTFPTSGHLDLTTVSVTAPDSHPRLPDILQGWWSSDEIVLPRDVVYPPTQSVSAVQRQNQTEMLDSQSAAVAAGLAKVGIDAVTVTVHEVLAGAPAQGHLRTGDEIVAVNGTAVGSTQQTVEMISGLAPGSRLRLSIRRGGAPRTVVVTTGESPDDAAESRIGVSLSDEFDPPFDVKIELGRDIGGPSAGLIFSLAVYDLLTPGKLTGGRYVAGTGTIDVSGVVGKIGGIQQKIAGAYANGARVFLVPADNCQEAGLSPLADKIDLVKVSTLDEAVTALEALDDAGQSSVARCGG